MKGQMGGEQLHNRSIHTVPLMLCDRQWPTGWVVRLGERSEQDLLGTYHSARLC